MSRTPPTMPVEPIVVDVLDAARMLRIGRSGVYDLMRAGELPSLRIGARRRIPVDAIEQYVATRLAAEGEARDG